MIKVILPDGFGFSDPVASLVPVHRGGIDSSWLTKRASVDFQKSFDLIKPAADHSLIHLIAMGATDTYGPNRNGDAFYRNAQPLDLVNPNWETVKLANGQMHKKSADTFADRTMQGLLDTYHTFSKNANVYKHHKNRPQNGDKIWGAVKAAGYNTPMDRVELMIEVPNDEWRDDLQKLSEDKQVPFSMACICNPATLIMTNHGYKPIVSVLPGDLVLTHRGNWKTVTKLNRRNYTGMVKSIGVAGSPFKMELTYDHPMLATLSKVAKSAESEEGYKKIQSDSGWVHTSHIEMFDFLMYMPPCAEFEGYEPIENPHIASALGEVISGTDESNTTKVVLGKYLGQGRDFYLGLFNSSHEVRMAFLGALIDGLNGDVDADGVTWIDTDAILTLYIRDLFMSVGIPCTMQTVGIELQDKEKSMGFMLSVKVAPSTELYRFSGKMHSDQYEKLLGEVPEDQEIYSNKYYPSQVVEVSSKEVTDIPVYNIEVADDESYLITGFVSHNCKVPNDICSECGHKAKHRGEYCEHLTEGLTDMLKSGHVVSAINDGMNFFDISRVHRPADRIAWSLVKSASALLRAADLPFTEEFNFYPDVNVPLVTTKKAQDRLNILNKAAEIEKQIPFSSKLHGMKSMVKAHGSGGSHGKCDKTAAFSALAKHNVCLPLEKFAELMFGNSTKLATAVANASQHLDTLFADIVKSANIDRVIANEIYDVTPYVTDHNLEKLASGLEKEHGFSYEAISDRVVRNAVIGCTIEKKASSKSPLTQVESELLEQYASYKLAFLVDAQSKNSENFDKILELAVLQNTV